MDWLSTILYTLVGVVIGGILGFYFTKKKFEKELKENPPINETDSEEETLRFSFMQIICDNDDSNREMWENL